ncbi:MAG: peptidoglycan DD-metalloendopeptidase family protein [Clostridia bacterium]|nr:peptidoglycan DD-metalloendopeptidase family protein [Clostridia bacterium]
MADIKNEPTIEKKASKKKKSSKLFNFLVDIMAEIVYAVDEFNDILAMGANALGRGTITAMAAIVTGVDNLLLLIDKMCLWIKFKVLTNVHHIAELIVKNAKAIVRIVSGVLITSIAMFALMAACTGYEYSYNGRSLGFINDQGEVKKVVEVINKGLSKKYDLDVNIDDGGSISYKRAVTINKDIDDADDVLMRLTNMTDANVKAFAIVVNDKVIAYLDSHESASKVLNNISEKYAKGDLAQYNSIGFKEKVEIKSLNTIVGNLKSPDSITKYILKHKTIHVKTVKTKVYKRGIKYKTVYKKTKNLYRGDSSVSRQGVRGVERVKAKITYINGKEVKRKILKKKVLSEPVTKIVLVGTTKRPPTVGDGHFIRPVNGVQTYGFGWRWGRHHDGIDIGVSTGTPIHAADGGTVVHAGWYYAYGYAVIIDHQNGYQTLYGHNSKILVHVGQKVYEGETIALAGSTGRSFGSHCHFEIHIHGTPVDPNKYV